MRREADGVYFVAGYEHYAFMSVGLHFGPLGHNFRLVTELDNVYDGVEARHAVGKDRNGRYIGGEDEDYGNLIGPLGPFVRGLYDKLIAGSSQ